MHLMQMLNMSNTPPKIPQNCKMKRNEKIKAMWHTYSKNCKDFPYSLPQTSSNFGLVDLGSNTPFNYTDLLMGGVQTLPPLPKLVWLALVESFKLLNNLHQQGHVSNPWERVSWLVSGKGRLRRVWGMSMCPWIKVTPNVKPRWASWSQFELQSVTPPIVRHRSHHLLYHHHNPC